MISVDTKKREQLGRLPMAGREWRPKGEPVQVEDHSFFFTGPEVEQAIPYGIYDITRDSGWVNVGTDHDTSVFAVESIRRWWRARGPEDYPGAARLLITADAGGSNSYRYRVWKSELAALAAETGLVITVCHFPPGTSKWNKIEHRLFSHITMNWRGRPLTSHEVVVQTIAATRTSRGLHVEAVLDPGDYPTGVAVSKERFTALPLDRHATHGTWNYTLRPAAAAPAISEGSTGQLSSPARRRQEMLAKLNDERLTGTTSDGLARLCAALAPLQAARAQQRYSQQRGGRARRATGNIRARPLFDDAARLLLTILYQRQVFSMNVLANLLEVTASCIGDLVKETREILEDHGHDPGVAPVRSTTHDSLLAFAGSDLRPARTTVTERLSHPALTGSPSASCTTSPAAWPRGEPPKPNASATSDAAAPASPNPRRRLPPEDQQQRTHPARPSPPQKTVHAGCPRRRPRRCQQICRRQRHPRNPAPAPARRPPSPASPTRYRTAADLLAAGEGTTRQIDSLQLHKTANVLAALPRSAHPAAKKALAEIWGAEDKDHARAAAKAFAAAYGAKFPKAAAKITDDLDQLLAFYDFPAEHWVHLRTTNPIESTFATVRHRTKVTKGPGSRAAGLAMAFKLIQSAQDTGAWSTHRTWSR